MQYKGAGSKPRAVSDVGVVLLQIIKQKGTICGYEIDKLVEERDYRAWTDIGTTSIYAGLKKLAREGLVRCYIDTDKQGKGPLPKKFRLTAKGERSLRNEVKKGLSRTRERDRRFDLALAAMPVLSKREVEQALKKRDSFLLDAAKGIERKFESVGGKKLPINIRSLFEHSLFLIEQERKFLDVLTRDLKREKKQKSRRA